MLIQSTYKPFKLNLDYGESGASAEIDVHQINYIKNNGIELTYIFTPCGTGDRTLRAMESWLNVVTISMRRKYFINYKSTFILNVVNKTITVQGALPVSMVISSNDIDGITGVNKCVFTLRADFITET